MKITKKKISNLTKCYAIAPLTVGGQERILVAAEKHDPCLLFDLEGNQVDQVWDEPGGVMTMVQVPGRDGQFLATHQFYSPNDSKEARIVVVTRKGRGQWDVQTLVDLPHVHRFDILTRNGVHYLIACALKSGHDYKEDWTKPGAVYAAVLPDDLSAFNGDNQLELTCIKDNMLKNHGYTRCVEDGVVTAIISADSGVYQFIPPASADGGWTINPLISEAASDAVYLDLDGDGEKELGVLSPFHGDVISIWKKKDGAFSKVWQFEKPAEFTHAIYGGDLCGKPAFVVGHRKGERNLMAITFDGSGYQVEVIDRDCGPANVFHFVRDGVDVILATNREIDEVAMYTLEEE